MKLKAFVLAVLSVLLMALPIVPGGVPDAAAQPVTDDDQRVADLSAIIDAFEAYGQAHGTYKIPGAGFEKRGYGRFNVGGTETYPFSLAEGLVAAGVLDPAAVPVSPTPDAQYGEYSVFLCKDRVVVFSIADDLTSDPDDVAWWNANCDSNYRTYRPYIQISDPYVYQGPVSVSPVSDIVAAIEAYGEKHNTYVIRDAGYDDLGYGWFSRTSGSKYDESLLNVLRIEGFLDSANVPEDPDALSSISQGIYVRRCSNRVGVFSIATEAPTQPTAEDAAWWADNNCSTAILDNYDHTYYELTEPLDYDQIRLDATAEIIAAMNAVAGDSHAIFLDGMGYDNDGRGWYSLQNGSSYETSIANGLAADGYLDPFDLPAEDPFHVLDYDNGYISFYCESRRAVFTRSGGIEPSAEDAAWWTGNNCPMPSSSDHTYYVLTDELPLDQIRQQAVSTIVDVLEDYGRDNFTYVVPDSGYQDDGDGSFNADRGLYDVSIRDGLIRDGYLQPDAVLREPLSRDGFDSNGIRVYRCQDRVAVFSLADTITPTEADTDWWNTNSCTTNGFTGGRTYFQLSDPLPLDEHRDQAIVAVLVAFEAYAGEHGTFLIDGAGYQGNGGSWFSRTTADYDPNVATALINAGYLTADPLPEDPHVNLDYTNGLRVEHCNDRVAVFSLSNGAQPAAEHATWWADNNCPTTSLDIGHTYFRLSQPASDLLIPPTTAELRQQAVAQTIAALESYGNANGTYTITGAGVNSDGTGWYQRDDGNGGDTIRAALEAGGHFAGAAVLVDPEYPASLDHDFIIHTCNDRVAVFAQTDTLVTFSGDLDWWTTNNCDTTALATHSYMRLTSALDVLDEPYTVTYGTAELHGHKRATVRLRPQDGPIGLMYAITTVIDAGGAPVSAPEFGCPDIGHCGTDALGRVHFVAFQEGGIEEPVDGYWVEIPEETDIIIEATTVNLYDLQNGAYTDTEWAAFLEANDYEPPVQLPDGPEWDDYVGLSNENIRSLDRCDVSNTYYWNWATVGLSLPENIELQNLSGGLSWTWDPVENSRDCYDWKTWGERKNGTKIAGTITSAWEADRRANLTSAAYDPNVAQLCIQVTPITWVSHSEETLFASPKSALHPDNPEPWARHCIDAPRNWGDTNCDGKTSHVSDFIAAALHNIFGTTEPCTDDYIADANHDGTLDALDAVFVLGCALGVAFGDMNLDDCDRLNINLPQAGQEVTATRDLGAITVEIEETSNGLDPVVTVLIGGETFDVGQPDGPGTFSFDLPPGTTEEVCIRITEQGPGASIVPSETCFDYFTVLPSVCGSFDSVIEVTNNGDEPRTYEVVRTSPNGSTDSETVYVGARRANTVELVDDRFHEVEVDALLDGTPIGETQILRTSQCATVTSDCSGNVIVDVDNVQNEPAIFQVEVTGVFGSVATAESSEVPPDAQSSITVGEIVYGYYDVSVGLEGEIFFEEPIHVGDGCASTDVCPNATAAYENICETSQNLFLSIEAAAVFQRVSGKTSPIIAFGGIDHLRNGVPSAIHDFARDGSLEQLETFALLAITQDELDDMITVEQVALRTRIALLAGVPHDEQAMTDHGLTIDDGVPGHTAIRNEHNIPIVAWEHDDQPHNNLSNEVEYFRRNTDTDPTSQRYQELWDTFDGEDIPDTSAAAAFVLFRTGNEDHADAVLQLDLGCDLADPECNPPSSDGGSWLGRLHFWLDIVGLTPVFGEGADFVNGVIYFVEEDDLNAAISLGAIVPAAGSVGTGSRIARSLPTNLSDEVVTGTRSYDNAGNWIYPVSGGYVVEGIEGTTIRSGSVLVFGRRTSQGPAILDGLSATAITDPGQRRRIEAVAHYLPNGQQDELVAAINNSTPEIAERIAENAALDPITTARILDIQQRGFPGLAETVLGNPQYNEALITATGAIDNTAYRSFRSLDEVLTEDYTDMDEFTTDLIGALSKNFDSPELEPAEMAALYRTTSPNPTLTDDELVTNFNAGQRYSPDAPDEWPTLHGSTCQTLRSFSADTLVLLADGTRRPISEIVVGDMVLATDPITGEIGAREVTAVLPHQDTLLDLVVDSGSVTTTEDHHFWNHTDQQWQETQNIDIGDELLTPDGGTVNVIGLDWNSSHEASAYDLTIDGLHTYYVAVGHSDVLVHNAPRCPVTPTSETLIQSLDPAPDPDEIDAWNAYVVRKRNEGPNTPILTPEDWRQRRLDLIESSGAGSDFEVAELGRLGLDKNTIQFGDDPGFIPDGLLDANGNPFPSQNPDGTAFRVPDGTAVNFTEIKNTAYLSDTGNVSAMLDHLDDLAENDIPGGFDLIVNTHTEFSAPLARILQRLDRTDQITIVVRVSGRTTPLDLADLPIRGG